MHNLALKIFSIRSFQLLPLRNMPVMLKISAVQPPQDCRECGKGDKDVQTGKGTRNIVSSTFRNTPASGQTHEFILHSFPLLLSTRPCSLTDHLQ